MVKTRIFFLYVATALKEAQRPYTKSQEEGNKDGSRIIRNELHIKDKNNKYAHLQREKNDGQYDHNL